MEDFNAESARNIIKSIKNDELHNVLSDIKYRAEQAETVLHVYKNLHQLTLDKLHEKGFKVVSQPSIAIQRDSLYYSIYWEL
jgi:hypothetical protein